MKIIITSPSLDVRKNVGGISSVTKFIIRHNAGHDYIHFELGKRDDEKRNLLWILRILGTYGKWVVCLLKNKKALVHFNIALERRSILRDTPLISFARLLGKRMIIHIHGGEYLAYKPTPGWVKRCLRFCFTGKYPKVLLSPIEVDELKHKVKLDNLFVLPNCVDLDDALLFKRKADELQEIKILFMGRISVSKGIELIYQAFQKLTVDGTRFTFILAGKGEDEAYYVPKFQKLLGNSFEFRGVVSGNEKTKLLKESTVFLLPSFFEGLPMALLEAMSFSLVPVVTDVGSIKYVVENGKNGVLINKGAAEEIVTSIKGMDADKKYMHTLGENAQKYIFENFNPAEYVTALNNIYSYE